MESNKEQLKEQILRALQLAPEPDERRILIEKLKELEDTKT